MYFVLQLAATVEAPIGGAKIELWILLLGMVRSTDD